MTNLKTLDVSNRLLPRARKTFERPMNAVISKSLIEGAIEDQAVL